MKKWGVLLLIFLVFQGMLFAEGSREKSAPAATTQEAYPVRPVKLIVPYAAGGGTDLIGRMVAQKLEQIIGQPVPIINIGGASGGLGMQELLKSPADGYTIGMDIINIWTRKALKTNDFGPEAFDLLAQCGTYYLVEATRFASPYKNLKELAEAAKKQPDSIQEATNIGAITHFTTLSFMDATGAKLRLVHIGDGAQRITSVLGGHVETTVMGTHEVLPYYQSKEMRVLGVASPKRIPGLEDAPTMAEQGMDVVQPVDYWFYMPKGSPKEKVSYITDALEKVMKDPEIIRKMSEMAMEPSFLRDGELLKRVDAQGKNIFAIAEKHNLGKK
ncbi:MAG: tripartite tricarboxylate transporter substrate binding protein [Spirochaetia bacterium]|jgi:tripartite-type tricarboxylate transporter receptor subunit TctC|nr:tripartite tricarboxylate transporter substrate binding protein [Spirochaetia bacterium]